MEDDDDGQESCCLVIDGERNVPKREMFQCLDRLKGSCWTGEDDPMLVEWKVISAAVGNELVVVTPIEACSEMFAGLTTGRGLGRSSRVALRLSSSMFFGWSWWTSFDRKNWANERDYFYN